MTKGLLTRLAWSLRSYWLPSLLSRDPALAKYFGSGPTSSGETVNEITALNCSAVWAAIQCIAGDVASLPLFHYKRLADGGKIRFLDSKLYRVIHDEFNPEMSAMVGRETVTAHALSWGNGYAEIQRNDLGQVVALWPLTPDRVEPRRETPTGPIVYRISTMSGTQVTVPTERIFHLPGLGFDGLQGYSVVRKARESIGLQLASERLGANMMVNGPKHSGYFQHPKEIGAEALKNLKESIKTDPPGSFRILEEGMTFKEGSMPLKDAQFLETRKFQVTEIARWFSMPPHKLADLERATFANIEEQNIDYVVGTLRRWLVRWEQECNRKLIAPLERRQQFCEHLVDGLLRGNIQSRYAAYAVGRNWGWLSADDVREFENMNPLPDGQGQVYLIPTNMAPADRTDEIIDAQVRPPAPPAPATPDAPATEDPKVRKLVEDLQAEIARRHVGFESSLAILHEAEARHQAALDDWIAQGVGPIPATPDDLTAATATVRDEVAALQERIAAVATTLASLDVREPVAALQATAAQIAARVEQPPAPTPPAVGVDEAILTTHLAPMREAIDTAMEAVEAITARLATEAELRGWRQATFALVAGKLVRRELAQARKREAKPTEALARAEAFYFGRFVPDSLAELRPWLLRMPEAAEREVAVQACLVDWAQAAVGAYGTALANGGLGALIRQWEMNREAALTRALTEAIDGHQG